MSLIAAVVLVIPTLLFLTEILTAFGASGQTLTYAYDFMLITLLGLPVTYVFFNLNHVMRATGYPKKAMGSTLLSVGINIILAPIFIFWFKWGITGAAVATLLAQVVGMVRVLLPFSDAASTVHFRRGIWQLRKTIVTGILSIGMAPCLVNVCGSAVTVAINRQLPDHGGDLAIGAYGIINRILILFAMLVIGLTQGIQPIIGYNHGAMKPGRVLLTLKYGVLAGTSFTTLGFLACVFFPAALPGFSRTRLAHQPGGQRSDHLRAGLSAHRQPDHHRELLPGHWKSPSGNLPVPDAPDALPPAVPAGPAPFLGTGRSLGIPSSGRRAFLYRHPALHPPIPEILPAEKQALPGSRHGKGIIFLPPVLLTRTLVPGPFFPGCGRGE